MGVLYHRPSPIHHLQELKSFLRSGGELVLETLILEGEGTEVLIPEDRYAKMRNVWFIPTTAVLVRMLERVGFINIRVVDVNKTSVEEQRSTEWMTYESLPDFLDPEDSNKTIEGDAAPVRAVVEVVPRTFHAHVVPHLKAAGFTIYPDAPSERSYFEVIAVRSPIIESSYIPFSYTRQGRGLSKVCIDGLTILTAHMESEKEGASRRKDQAAWVLEHMNANEPCIFGGDTNLRKSEWEGLSPINVSDAWERTGSSKKHRITWEQNQFKARYDRVWAQGLNIKSFETIGTSHVPSIKERPSDHRGMKVEFDHL
ncbi:tRNA U34 carboxymethyltransferase [Nymphon striatum]|nr:tRNA U34 carboxymethyltransferase [Nymphon striatum]